MAFIDAGLMSNCPLHEAEEEATRLWTDANPIRCMVSIGCGLFGMNNLDQSKASTRDFVIDPIRLAIKGNAVAARFEDKYSDPQVPGEFYRLNVTHGAEKVKFDERFRRHGGIC